MDFGDLFYIIILLVFMILGFFNDSRKKKNEQNQQSEQKPRSFKTEEIEYDDQPPLYRSIPPPIPEKKLPKIFKNKTYDNRGKEGEVSFQSSLDLVTDFKKESTLGSSFYTNDTDSIYDSEEESVESTGNFYDEKLVSNHSIIRDLTGDNRRNEMIKGIVYSEIVNRRY